MNGIRKPVVVSTTALLVFAVARVAQGVAIVPFCADFHEDSHDWGLASGASGSFYSWYNPTTYHAEMIAGDWGLVNVSPISLPLYRSSAGGETKFTGQLYRDYWWVDLYLDGPVGSYADVTLDWEFRMISDVMAFAVGASYVHSDMMIRSYSGGPVTPADTRPNQVTKY